MLYAEARIPPTAARRPRTGAAPRPLRATDEAEALAVRARAEARLARSLVASVEAPDGCRLVVRLSQLQRARGRVVGDLRLTCRTPEGRTVVRSAGDVLLAVSLRPRWPDETPELAVDTLPLRRQVLRLAPLTLLDSFVEYWVGAVARRVARFAQDDEDAFGRVDTPVPVDDIRVPMPADWTLLASGLRFDGALRGDVALVDEKARLLGLLAGRDLVGESGEPTGVLCGAVARRAGSALAVRLQLRAARDAGRAAGQLAERLRGVWWALASCNMGEIELP